MKKLLFAVALLGAGLQACPSPATAHETSYCGTGTAGIWEQTWYQHRHYTLDWKGHVRWIHHYSHTFMGVQTHEEHRAC